jgi:hypothetical protein
LYLYTIFMYNMTRIQALPLLIRAIVCEEE